MSEYRVAHVALTCMAVYVAIESAMIAWFREYGLMSVTSGTFTPVPVDAASYQAWLGMSLGVLVVREPLCRVMFRRRPEPEPPREAFAALYKAGARLLGTMLLLVFAPHLVLLTRIEHLDAGFSAAVAADPALLAADAAVVLFALLLWVWPRPFTAAAMLGSRAS